MADFSAAYGITFPLLSDPNSEIITSFGILNTLIPPDDHPWYGVPFPGTYLIDANGVITHKFFEQTLSIRIGAEQILAAAQGEELPGAESTGADVNGPAEVAAVTVDVEIDRRALPEGMRRDLVARFRVPAGQHLYGEPVPEGMVAAAIVLDDTPGLLPSETEHPPTRPLVLRGTGETLHVYEGDVTLRRPIAHNGSAGMGPDDERILTIGGEVRWQSCDDMQCGLPQRQRFELTIPISHRLWHGMRSAPGELDPSEIPDANEREHLTRMIDRRRPGDG